MGDVYEIHDDGNEIDRFEVRDLRVKTRFCIDNQFYDEFAPVLGCNVSMVYVALVRHANKDQKTWPSQVLISQQLGISRQWISTFLRVLRHFNLIRIVRVGKRCNNRYYLVDQRLWRRDFEVMLSEVETAIHLIKENEANHKKGEILVMSPEVTSLLGDIRCLERLHHMLSRVTSNSKDKQERINKKGKGKITIKKSSKKLLKQPPNFVNIGKGSKVRTYYDEEKNTMFTENYD